MIRAERIVKERDEKSRKYCMLRLCHECEHFSSELATYDINDFGMWNSVESVLACKKGFSIAKLYMSHLGFTANVYIRTDQVYCSHHSFYNVDGDHRFDGDRIRHNTISRMVTPWDRDWET